MRRSFDLKFKLEVIKFAEGNSGEAAARAFGIDPKSVRVWRKQKDKLIRLCSNDKGTRKNISGQGRKVTSDELEASITQWIKEKRENGEHVSMKMVSTKAQEIFPHVNDKRRENFAASKGWAKKLLRRSSCLNNSTAAVVEEEPECSRVEILIKQEYEEDEEGDDDDDDDEFMTEDHYPVVEVNTGQPLLMSEGEDSTEEKETEEKLAKSPKVSLKNK